MSWVRPRILVVAVSPALCCVLEELLCAYGFDVTATTNSEAARRLSTDGSFAALLNCWQPAIDALDHAPDRQREPQGETETWPVVEGVGV